MANKSAIPYDNVIETLRRQSIKQPKELLQHLYTAYSESTSLQLLPFVPIKSVGIIEGFCTIQYQMIIDSDATYRKRFLH